MMFKTITLKGERESPARDGGQVVLATAAPRCATLLLENVRLQDDALQWFV